MPCKCIGSVDVTIYRTPTSTDGKQAKDFFERKGVAYQDFDITSDPIAYHQMEVVSGQVDQTVIVVGQKVFVGFNQEELEPVVPSFF